MRYVYCIKCKCNGKVYIGETNNYKRRISEHKQSLKKGTHYNSKLQEDYNKYGLSCFEFGLLDTSIDKESLQLEHYYIELNGGVESTKTYNYYSCKGRSKELQNKINHSLKENKKLVGERNPQYGKHTNNWNHPCWESTKLKISQSMTTKPENYKDYSNKNLKYNKEFIKHLRKLKAEGNTITSISKSYHISRSIVSCLINYGRSNGKG